MGVFLRIINCWHVPHSESFLYRANFFVFLQKKEARRPLVAGLPLVHVPKPRSGSKYSGQLRSPHKLKFAGTP